MIFKIAWRNIWRSRVRSLVVATAIALGLFAGLFSSAFYEGMINQKIENVIELEMSHFQVHHPKFREELLSNMTIPNSVGLQSEINADSSVTASTGRVVSMVMMASANQSGGVKAVGIDPTEESNVTVLHQKITEGEYFEGIKRNPILISEKLAEKYRVKLRSKVVLTMQDVEGEIIAGSFRVVGIFNSGNGMYDEANVFVRRSDMQNLLGIGDSYHEIAVLVNTPSEAENVASRYAEAYPDLEIKPWLDLAVGMRYMVEAMGTYAYIIVGIILFALLFSIVNTMLMAVLERTREIGMLMAVGMNKNSVFQMIMLETIFLSLLGGPAGLAISYILISYFGGAGMDLGSAGEMYSDLGFASVIYPSLGSQTYINVTIMVVVMAVFAAVYPAWKALRLNPSEAIRKI